MGNTRPYKGNKKIKEDKSQKEEKRHRDSHPVEIYNDAGTFQEKDDKKNARKCPEKGAGKFPEKDGKKATGKDGLPTSNPPTYTSQESVKRDAANMTEQAHENWSLPKEQKPSQHDNSSKFEDRFMKVCKVILYVFLFVVVHGSGVYSLLEMFSLTSLYGKESAEDKEDVAVGILICMGFASVLTLLLALWRSIFQDRERLLKRKTTLVVTLELLSTSGEIILVMIVLPGLNSSSAIVALLAIIAIPSLFLCVQFFTSNYRSELTQGSENPKCVLFWLLMSSFIPFGGSVAVLVIFALRMTDEYSVLLPLAVLLRSLGYWENFTFFRVFPNNNNNKKRDIERNNNGPPTPEKDKKDSANKNEINDEDASQKQTKKEDNVGKCLRSLSRVALLLIMLVLIKFHVTVPYLTDHLDFQDYVDDNDISNHTNTTIFPMFPKFQTNQTTTVNRKESTTRALWIDKAKGSSPELDWVLDIYNDHKHTIRMVFFTIVFPYFASTACRLQMQIVAFTIPLFLVPVTTYAITILGCGRFTFLQDTLDVVLTCDESGFPDFIMEVTSGVGLLLAMMILLWYHLKPNIERMAKYERIYALPPRNGILPVFDVLLNRKNDRMRSSGTDTASQSSFSISNSRPSKPDIYICCTMWHETKREMQQLLKSLFKLDQYIAGRRAFYSEHESTYKGNTDPDDVKISYQIVFDNAFEYTELGPVLNQYVLQFIECLEKLAREAYPKNKRAWRYKPYKAPVLYGGRLNFILPGDTKLTVHLKDKQKVRIKKRWSQVLYMYYTLLFGHESMTTYELKKKLKNTFIFTLDGDVDFEPKAVRLLMDRMKKNPDVGAVCGRIHPIGSGPMIWYQQFEYAVGHWLQKASEHVFGCVLCCPGCFSLFRASALVDDNVLKTYTREPEEGSHLVQFEQGEDRWLCTLLLKRGYKIDYCAGADAKTFAPEGFFEFFIQRRRWSPSTLANMIDLINSWGEIVMNNNEINHFFMFYQFVMVATSLIAPATVIILIAGSFSTVLHIGAWKSFFVAVTPIIVFAISCLVWKQSKQLVLAGILSAIYTFVMIIVTIGMVLSIVSDSIFEPNVLFLIFVGGIFLIAGIIHPKEFSCLFGGLLYYVTVPSTFIFLTVFFVFNMNDVSWGTREKKTDQAEAPIEKSLIMLIKDYLKKFLKEKIETALNSNVPIQPRELAEHIVHGEHTETPAPARKDETYWLKSRALRGFKTKVPENENTFWKEIISNYLKPLESNKELQQKFQEELVELRNKCVFGFIMANLMLAFALLQLQVSREQLVGFYVLGRYEPVSSACLIVFALLITVQVLGMFKHTWGMFLHLISTTELWEKGQNFDKRYEELEQELDEDNSDNNDAMTGDDTEEPSIDYNELEPDYSDFSDGEGDAHRQRRQSGAEAATCATAAATAEREEIRPPRHRSRPLNIYATRVQRAVKRNRRIERDQSKDQYSIQGNGRHRRGQESTYDLESGGNWPRNRFRPAYNKNTFDTSDNNYRFKIF